MTESPSPAPAGCRYHGEILPPLLRFLEPLPRGSLVLDAGCGHGYVAGQLMARGYVVAGVDLSPGAITACRQTYPGATFEVASACDPDLPRLLRRTFDAVVALEVIEHLAAPAAFFRNAHALLRPGGLLIVSTPYHGYAKNLLLALFNRLDRHLQPDQEGGHIKFWSRRTLTQSLAHHGFRVTGFAGCGRVPGLWKSMVVRAERLP